MLHGRLGDGAAEGLWHGGIVVNFQGQRVVVTRGGSLGRNWARPLRVAVVLNHAVQADVVSGVAHIDGRLATPVPLAGIEKVLGVVRIVHPHTVVVPVTEELFVRKHIERDRNTLRPRCGTPQWHAIPRHGFHIKVGHVRQN
eukprot:881099-Prymnesium_polylepis.1